MALADAQPRPRYLEVKAHILDRIRSGALGPGERVPSENEITSLLGVSRMTANRALRELTQEGFLDRVAGVGTFVRPRLRQASLVELRDIAEEITARGHAHEAQVVSSATVAAAAPLARHFEERTGAPLFHVTIVHREDGVPVQFEDRYVNPAVAPRFLEQDFRAITTTAYLVATVPADEVEHAVEAAMPSTSVRALLEMGEGEPCLALHRRSRSGGRVVTVVTLTYPASRYRLYGRFRPPHPTRGDPAP